MKKRIYITVIILVLTILSLAITLPFLKSDEGVFFGLMGALVLLYLAFFTFGGLAKLIIYLTYGLVTMLFIVLLPGYYRIIIAILGTLLFVFNPLANFETYLEKNLKEEDVLPLRFSIHGSYWPIYEYRKLMKEYYHLPQVKKLYTKKWYMHLRQIVTVVLLAVAIFLLINEIGLIADLKELRADTALSSYGVIILFIMAMVLYKKGFQSLLRVISVSIFPPVIFLIMISSINLPIRFLISGIIVTIGIAVSIYELYKLFQRVVYSEYNYFDMDKNLDVYANALFEPLVYNETYTLVTNYKIKVSLKKFKESFDAILVYANWHRFMITAYAYDGENVILHADFHKRMNKRVNKFLAYLESLFQTSIKYECINDSEKTIYEKEFFHKKGYIGARVNYLANLLKEFEIETDVVISFIVYFNDSDHMKEFYREYPYRRLEMLDEDDNYAIKVDIKSINSEYLIDEKVRKFLFSLMVHDGHYVRVTLFSVNKSGGI